MLTDLDPRVSAHLNLHAVLGSLPLLTERVPAARELLAGLTKPVTLKIIVRGGGPVGALTFSSSGVTAGEQPGAAVARLILTSPEHFNKVIAGTAQPIPVAGPTGLAFLTKVFTPLTDVLGTYLEPAPEALADDAFRTDSVLLTLRTVAAAIAVVGNEDRSGRYSVAQMPDGNVDLEVGDDLRHQLQVRSGTVTFVERPDEPPRAALRFADLDVAGGVLGGELSALACICDGRLAMRGMISMVDNVNRILDRAGHYLRK